MPLNVVHVIDSEGLYGAERVVLDLMETHEERGISSSLISVGSVGIGPKAIEKEGRRRGLKVSALRFSNGPNFNGALKIVKAASSVNAEIFHTHGYKADILLGLLPRSLRKLPMISTLHGWTSTRAISKMKIYEWLQLRALKRSEAIAAVSRHITDHPGLRKLSLRAEYIPNGTRCIEFDPNVLGLHLGDLKKTVTNSFSIVSIGRLSTEKGYDILIRACASLKDRGIDVRLILIGEGDQKRILNALVKKVGIQRRIHFLGYIPNAYHCLPCFDAFVISSLTEGLPISLLEAMQAGIPIVSTAVGSIPEVLGYGRYGRLVDKGNIEALTDALAEVHNSPEEFNSIAAAAKSRALQEYSLETMADRYGTIYNHLYAGASS
jgi:glycosyltransferase involved in cell wall biosynthesis